MNRWQRVTLIIGLLLVVIVSLFPAYEGVYAGEGDNFRGYLGHHFVAIPPSDYQVYCAFMGKPPTRTVQTEVENPDYVEKSDFSDFLEHFPEQGHTILYDVPREPPTWTPPTPRTVLETHTEPEDPATYTDFRICCYIIVTETALELLSVVALTCMLFVLFMGRRRV